MAVDKRISELTAAGTLSGSEVAAVVQSGATVKATLQAIADLAVTGVESTFAVAQTYGRDSSSTTGLTWGYHGGHVGSLTIADGTVALTASRTNYIVAHRTTGVVSASTSGLNWCTPQTYVRLYKAVAGASTISSYTDYRLGRGGIFGVGIGGANADDEMEFPIQVGDVGTTITTGTRKAVWRAPCPMLVTDIRAGLATVSSSGAPALDINDSGDSIFATTLTIDANEKTNQSAATAYVLKADAGALLDDTEISVDIDTAGTGATGPVLWLKARRGAGDPAWDLVKSALTLEGSNAGTTFNDAISGRTWVVNGTTQTSTAQSVNGTFASYAASSGLFGGGATDYLRSDASADFDLSNTPWCLQMWVRFSSVANSPQLINIGNDALNRLSIYLSTSMRVYSVTTAGNGADRITGASPSTATWYFVELIYDLTTLTLWIDGVSQGTYTGTILPTGALYCDLGNYVYAPSGTFVLNGHMQRFRFTRGWHRRTGAYSRPPKPWTAY